MTEQWGRWDRLLCKIGLHQWCWVHFIYMAPFRECNRCGARAHD